jgi:putative addiction module component (TIGR02574 family)
MHGRTAACCCQFALIDLSARLLPMNTRIEQILNDALGLSVDERSALTIALIDSLEGSDDSAITDAWRIELKARQAALRNGLVEPHSWADAKARISAL